MENRIGDTILALRKWTGLSQTEFGNRLDIPMRSIQNWENGVSKCPGYVVKLISYWVEHENPKK